MSDKYRIEHTAKNYYVITDETYICYVDMEKFDNNEVSGDTDALVEKALRQSKRTLEWYRNKIAEIKARQERAEKE